MEIKRKSIKFKLYENNMFGFDFYFIPKGTRLSTWETKLISGSNLTNIDFANITSQMKFIDTYKYFQNS